MRSSSRSAPQPLFDAPAVARFPYNDLEIASDGQRFLLLTLEEAGADPAPSEPSRIHVLLNWAEELRRRVTPR